MPTMTAPRTPTGAHTIRVSDALWNAALERAAEQDESVSAVIRRALRQYTKPDTDA